MADNEYVTFLILGVLFIAIDGQILYRGGRRLLSDSSGNAESNASMARMVTVVFHLISLGVLALLSLIHIGTSTSTVVARMGIFLLFMAAAHALTVSVLAHQREERVFESQLRRRRELGTMEIPVDDTAVPRNIDASAPRTTVAPVPGQPGARAQVSPGLEYRGPYST
jgi:hypothetical protein